MVSLSVWFWAAISSTQVLNKVYVLVRQFLLYFVCLYWFAIQSLPRFKPENVEHNKHIFERVSEIATTIGCTSAQLALAWVHLPIPGTTKIANLNVNIGALSVKLTLEVTAELESLASEDRVKGNRYGGITPTWMNSKTPPLASWKLDWTLYTLCCAVLHQISFFCVVSFLWSNLLSCCTRVQYITTTLCSLNITLMATPDSKCKEVECTQYYPILFLQKWN